MSKTETYNEALARLAKERRAKALALAEAGLKLHEIADVMGLSSKQRAHQLVKQAKADRASAR